MPASGPVWPRSSWQRAKSVFRLHHAAGPVLALGELPLRRPEQLDAPLGERGGVRLGRRVLPHAHVHGRGREDGPAEGEPELGEDVVGQPVRQLGERVRRERRDDEQVRIDEVRIEVPRRLAAGERLEGVRGHEPLGIRCQDRSDLVARPYEESAKLARLVGGDPTRDSEKNSSHRGSQRLLSPAARL